MRGQTSHRRAAAAPAAATAAGPVGCVALLLSSLLLTLAGGSTAAPLRVALGGLRELGSEAGHNGGGLRSAAATGFPDFADDGAPRPPAPKSASPSPASAAIPTPTPPSSPTSSMSSSSSESLLEADSGALYLATNALETLLLPYMASTAATSAAAVAAVTDSAIASGSGIGGTADDLNLQLLQLHLQQMTFGGGLREGTLTGGGILYDDLYDSAFDLAADDSSSLGRSTEDAEEKRAGGDEAPDLDMYDTYDMEVDDVDVRDADDYDERDSGGDRPAAAAAAAAVQPRNTAAAAAAASAGDVAVPVSRRRRQLLDGDNADQIPNRSRDRPPRKEPADLPPANVWVPGVVRVTRDAQGDVKVRVGPLGSIASVNVIPDKNARRQQQSASDVSTSGAAAAAPAAINDQDLMSFRAADRSLPNVVPTAAGAGILAPVLPGSAVSGGIGRGFGAATGGLAGTIAGGTAGRVVGSAIGAAREAAAAAEANVTAAAVEAAVVAQRSGLVSVFGPDPEVVLQQSAPGGGGAAEAITRARSSNEDGGGGGGSGGNGSGGGGDGERDRPRVAVTVGPGGALLRSVSGREGSLTSVGMGGIARVASRRP